MNIMCSQVFSFLPEPSSLSHSFSPFLSFSLPSPLSSFSPSLFSPPLFSLPLFPPSFPSLFSLLFLFPRVSEFEQQLRRERELAAVAKDLSEAVKDPEIQATKVEYEWCTP